MPAILAQTNRAIAALMGGTNMAAIHLANAVGGNLFLGFISAVAFATILAVVSGLTLAGASAISHDLYASVIARAGPTSRTRSASRRSPPSSSASSPSSSAIVFENQNVAFMVGLAFAVAASLQLPGAA